MKKLTSIMMTIAVVFFFTCGSAIAIDMQTLLNDITDDGNSTIDATSDFIEDSSDSYWNTTATSTSASTIVYEIASANGLDHKFGIYGYLYNELVMVEIFNTAAEVPDSSTITLSSQGYLKVNSALYKGENDNGKTFNTGTYGYYITTNEDPAATYFSDSNLNGGVDHMLAFQGVGQNVSYGTGGFAIKNKTWTDKEYILGFKSTSEINFTDFVVMVESTEPVPEPSTMLLMGIGLLGLAGYSRKRFAKKS